MEIENNRRGGKGGKKENANLFLENVNQKGEKKNYFNYYNLF